VSLALLCPEERIAHGVLDLVRARSEVVKARGSQVKSSASQKKYNTMSSKHSNCSLSVESKTWNGDIRRGPMFTPASAHGFEEVKVLT
jgi:hypothetical protein